MPELACASAPMHNVGSFTWRGSSARRDADRGTVRAVTCSHRLEKGSGWPDRHKRSSVERRDRRRPWKSASGGRQVRHGTEGDGLQRGTASGEPERGMVNDHGDRGERARARERSGIARVARCATKEQWGEGARERDG